ncbi:Extracellular membrane protein, CFEM domain protein [Ophiocordyceps camponoti-floridani]|uniref:Extracellular membrane protein, CFEM domain protein n=1 Tax=Ophiocordyceps camponoti-floridani TaxID=2030778 RepID=A0A8H4VGK8_9HYPO|nr:Extracellular membrane protein, CFEM domain protein [Ophiocordyceps camponoti-floridani]
MGRLAPLVVVAALTISNAAAQNPGTPPCIPECANRVRADFAKFTCQNANDAACLCTKDNFSFGVRDCGAHCGANDDNVRQFLLGSFCAGGVFPQSASTQAQATPTSPLASTQPLSTSAIPSTTQQTTSSFTNASSSIVTTSSSATSASETSSDVEAAPPSSTSTEAEVSTAPAGSSSQGTVIGIGIGVGAAVIALAGVVICFLLRGRKQKPRHSIEISKPLPGSGRAYAGRERNSFEKQGNDIEMTSHRYEDMVPRQQPRTMV